MRTDIDPEQLRSLANGHEFIEVTAEEALDLADALETYYALQEQEQE